MDQGRPLFFVLNPGARKKDLVQKLEEILLEFKNKEVNGSIALHFSEGYLAKIHSTRVD